MGFYGNISNVNKTNMTFDKVYSNRKAMDESCALDGVYTGRYVLVEYEQYYPLDTLPIIYKLSGDKSNKYYTDYGGQDELKIQEGVIYRCVILTNWLNDVANEDDLLLQYYSNIFYRGVAKEGEPPFLENMSSEISEQNYVGNFNIDRIEYGTSRGYDSTVWMKQYDTNGIPKYVNIAELNSVVPTFDVSVDAPTEKPQSPHFDANSTNIYYNLHVQPQWGFRIKSAENSGLSDVEIDGDKKAIYFNRAGFDKNDKDAYVNLETAGEDFINITPTGVSGQLYNSHEKGQPKQEAPDIQELSINLPSIGNMMSDAWDIIHGPNRDDDMREYDENGNYVDSLQGRLKSIRLCEGETIPIKRGSDGRIIGARLNDASQYIIDKLEVDRLDALSEAAKRNAAGEFATEELYNAEKERINKEYDELIEAYRNTSGETDDWITATIDSENLNIAIKHKTNFEENQTNSRNSQNPVFGSSFNIPIITADKAGHIISLEDNSVQLPLNGSSLKLEEYSLNENNIGSIQPQDNLTTAFNRVENETIKLSENKMNKENPSGSGTLSLNRKASSTIGNNSVAIGFNTTASGDYSYAEGYHTTASNDYSHAEGYVTEAYGDYAHAEGNAVKASGKASHAEGSRTEASGDFSHAEGWSSTAYGDYAHAEGCKTAASGNYSHAQGKYNIEDENNIYAHIVGNGSSSVYSNAHTLDWNGTAWFSGDVYVGSTSGTNKDEGSKILATQEYVDNAVSKDGKGLSTNDYTTAEKNKLANIAEGAQVNVNADWNATEGDAQILNKPTLGALAAKDSLTAEDVGALSDTTTIPTKLSNLENDVGYLTEHQSLDGYAKTTDIPTVPTLISAFENDKGYLTEHQSLDEYVKTADVPNIVLNMSDFIALQDKVNELEERIAQLENPTTTE